MSAISSDNKKIDNPEQFILTIYTGQENFSVSLHDPRRKGSFFYKELNIEKQTNVLSAIKEAFSKSAFFSLPFRKVMILYRTPVFTYIPNSLYNERFKDEFLFFQFPEKPGVNLNHLIYKTKINVIYQLPKEFYQFILRSFIEPEFIHYSAPMISYLLQKSANATNRWMVINLQENGMDIFCFSGEIFVMGNYYKCNGISEALYYILFAWKQLQFNQLNDSLHIYGEATFKEELVDKLSNYIKMIYKLVIPSVGHFEGVRTDKVPFELAALSLCGL